MERNYIVERGLEKRFNEKKINLKHMEKSYTIKKAWREDFMRKQN